jgi:hypothetical protein
MLKVCMPSGILLNVVLLSVVILNNCRISGKSYVEFLFVDCSCLSIIIQIVIMVKIMCKVSLCCWHDEYCFAEYHNAECWNYERN